MKVRSDILKVYKDLHIWTGIITGMALYIAFLAGALTMFQTELGRWASPAPKAPQMSLAQLPQILAALDAAYPASREGIHIQLDDSHGAPPRVTWGAHGMKPQRAELLADGRLLSRPAEASPFGQFINDLHQQAGLPFGHNGAMPIVGLMCLAYGLALVSGVVIFLPAWTRDLFSLRIGHNLKRLWLDVHNALGVMSLPFHLVMALTSVIFAFHGEIYAIQDKMVYPQGLGWQRPDSEPVCTAPLPVPELIARVRERYPDHHLHALEIEQHAGEPREIAFQMSDMRHLQLGRLTTRVQVMNACTGALDEASLPGRLHGWEAMVSSFFALHFGNFGGTPVRWLYFLMGLAGAALFYTGNLLWLESRRRKNRHGAPPRQTRSARAMGGATVGIGFGAIAGIALSMAGAPLLAQAGAALLAHWWVYGLTLCSACLIAMTLGNARALCVLPAVAAACCVLVALTGGLARAGAFGWSMVPRVSIAVELTALASAAVLGWIARRGIQRAKAAPHDSIWALPPAR